MHICTTQRGVPACTLFSGTLQRLAAADSIHLARCPPLPPLLPPHFDAVRAAHAVRYSTAFAPAAGRRGCGGAGSRGGGGSCDGHGCGRQGRGRARGQGPGRSSQAGPSKLAAVNCHVRVPWLLQGDPSVPRQQPFASHARLRDKKRCCPAAAHSIHVFWQADTSAGAARREAAAAGRELEALKAERRQLQGRCAQVIRGQRGRHGCACWALGARAQCPTDEPLSVASMVRESSGQQSAACATLAPLASQLSRQ
jgi:hypothetical protein